MARKNDRFWTLPGGRIARCSKRRGGEHDASGACKQEPRWRRRQEALANELLWAGFDEMADGEEEPETD